ncbi:CD225/dispanin family protein [Streptomyces sp. NPDC029044]|uniref:CD225/dispanin family protein n=1 Tax=Streptomyces sp. NPDC029044 TaxID=3157198 RepID=UPI0033F4A9BF
MADNRASQSPDDGSWGPQSPWQESSTSSQGRQSQMPEDHQQFSQQQWQGAYPGQRMTPPTYMVGAILVTLFCFLPTGIAAIVFSSQVSAKANAGDLAGAAESSRKARLWVIVSLAAGVVAWIILMVVSLSTSSTTALVPAP